MRRVLWISVLVVVIDQVTKQIVARTMTMGSVGSIPLIGDWLKFTYTENPGMAFGIEFGPPGMITIFSIIATILIGMYFWRVSEGFYPYRFSLAMVFGGAIGNIIDRTFYGLVFGHNGLFRGRVVDFIHVDLGFFQIPDFVPLLGGSVFPLFPIWNVADMAIVLGVVGILWFQRGYHERLMAEKGTTASEAAGAPDASTTDEAAAASVDASPASTNGATPAPAMPAPAADPPGPPPQG